MKFKKGLGYTANDIAKIVGGGNPIATILTLNNVPLAAKYNNFFGEGANPKLPNEAWVHFGKFRERSARAWAEGNYKIPLFTRNRQGELFIYQGDKKAKITWDSKASSKIKNPTGDANVCLVLKFS